MRTTGLVEKTTIRVPAAEESSTPTASTPAPTIDAAEGSDDLAMEPLSDVLAIDDEDSIVSVVVGCSRTV